MCVVQKPQSKWTRFPGQVVGLGGQNVVWTMLSMNEPVTAGPRAKARTILDYLRTDVACSKPHWRHRYTSAPFMFCYPEYNSQSELTETDILEGR
jgi:hypothetical protein